MLTYEDFTAIGKTTEAISKAIREHLASAEYKTAVIADEYDRQRNATIAAYRQTLYNVFGDELTDFTASDNRIASNFFNRLNTQRVMYSLGNGVSFADGSDEIKDKLGPDFDFELCRAGLCACKHGKTFLFWNLDRLHVFPLTEFVPLLDESDGTLRAGIRFWRVDENHRANVVLYEEDGITRFSGASYDDIAAIEDKHAYIVTYSQAPADDDPEVLGEDNYSSLPIVTMYASRLRQSTIVGMRGAIDSYDLIRSGFANDLQDCAQIYWLVENAAGMQEDDLERLRDQLKTIHIGSVDSAAGGKLTPYQQEVPYQARQAYLDSIRAEIYESFGALDVHTISAGSTNDHIDAAYQPLDENAADFEHWVADAVRQLLLLQGIDATPTFHRNRISNQKEQVEILVQESAWLDEETILRKLPNVTADEVQSILDARDDEDMKRAGVSRPTEDVTEGE